MNPMYPNYPQKKFTHSGPRFEETLMGKRYLTGTIPSLVQSVNELNATLQSSETPMKKDIAHELKNVLTKLTSAHIDSDFFQTVGGSRYYNHTLPSLVKSINELTQALVSEKNNS